MKKLFIILFLLISITSFSQQVNPKDFYGITYSALTFGTTTTWDYQTGSHKTLTLTGNSTLSISNAYNGANGVLIITMGGSGGYTISVPNGTITLNSSVGEVTTIAFSYDGSTYHWAGGKAVGGTGTPSGSNGNAQINRNGSFHGSDSLSVDSNKLEIRYPAKFGNDSNNLHISLRQIPAVAGGGGGGTSYANTGGSGDRTAIITVTQGGGIVVGPGPLSDLVNGSNADVTNWFTSGGAVAGTYIRFDMNGVNGSSNVVDEVTFKQSAATSHGVWKWQAGDNGTTWTDIGSSFTLGGSATQTITTLSGNTTGYRYYQLIGVSGNSSSTPYIREFEFKIGTTGGGGGGSSDSTHIKIFTNTTGIALGDTLTKKVAIGTHVFDSTFKVEGSTNLNGRVRVGTVDSTGSPINMATFDANGNLKKAAVPSGGSGTPAGSDREIQLNNSGAFGASSNAKINSSGELLMGGVSDLGTYDVQSVNGFYHRKDAFDYFYYDPATSNAELKLSASGGTFDVTKPMQGNYGFRVKNSSGGSIDFGGQTGTGFAPYIIMRPDRTLQNYGLISVIADDAGSNPALILSSATSSAGALATQDLLGVVNNTTYVFKIAANGHIALSGITTPTAFLHLPASTTGAAPLRIPSGTAPTSPNHGDVWTDASHIYARLNGVTYQLDQQSSNAIVQGTNTLGQNTLVNLTGSYEWKFSNGTKFGVDLTANGTDATGDIFYRGSDGYLKRLAIGSAGQVLKVNTGLPSWQNETTATTLVEPLNSQYTNAGNVGTGTDDLMTFTLPSNTLVNDGSWIEFECGYVFAANTNNKDVIFQFGSVQLTLPTNNHAAGGAAILKGKIIRTSSTTCRITYVFDPLNGSGTKNVTDGSSLDYTATIVIKSTGSATSDNDIVQKTFTAELHQIPPP